MGGVELYTSERGRLIDIVRGAGADVAAKTMVPASPAWSVKDVMAHLAGIAADTVAGRVEGVGSDPWTAAQVEERRDVNLDDIIAEWEREGPAFERLLGMTPPHVPVTALGDLMTHAHDIYAALGVEGPRDGDADRSIIEYYLERFRRRAGRTDLPPLHVVTEVGEWDIGEGDPKETVRTSHFELLRALTGRRSEAQIRAWDWSTQPDGWLPLISTYGTPDADLVE